MHERKLTAITRVLRKDMRSPMCAELFFPAYPMMKVGKKLNYSRYVNLFHIYLSYIVDFQCFSWCTTFLQCLLLMSLFFAHLLPTKVARAAGVSSFSDNARIKHYILFSRRLKKAFNRQLREFLYVYRAPFFTSQISTIIDQDIKLVTIDWIFEMINDRRKETR